MKMKCLFLLSCLLISPYIFAQYTETINSNRPGNSQGAYAVGNGVLQAELGLRLGKDKHELLDTETSLWGVDYELRYGFFMEQLEVNLRGSFLNSTEKFMIANAEEERSFSNFESNTLGAKFLFYDPNKKRILEGPNLYSWKANNRMQLRDLIPSLSIYAGFNLLFGDTNPYIAPENDKISPQVALISQNNLGRWVFVMNIIADQLLTEIPSYSGIFTVTHALNRELSFFGEYQIINSDFYSDDILRFGAAYLFGNDFQVDASALLNFKDTPSRWQIALGVSYRLDMHSEDEYIIDDKEDKEKVEEKEKEAKEDREDGFEGEVIE